MSRRSILVLVFALVASSAFGGPEIRQSDVPEDAPRFKDYPATPYAGPNATPDVRSDPRSRMYRTLLKGWATEKPNFAGHYILATWGCGTGCTQIAVIDAITEKVFHPPGARTNSVVDVHEELLVGGDTSPRRADFGALRYSVGSRLLVLIGTPEERAENRGISYFVWEDDSLTRVRLVAKAAGK
jgi:hypothetical protein